ncbi:hypothetical protein MPDQ_001870 [Monascus purpureus]|uniref:Rab-GAP TBC domain-containing protein n=1 Tax=Monascus purpureus TaxID=5098 RepID=A0A507QQT4_MONPU|nr:hypothetical protein MPDQ_001870 [Monascus purpureus]
MAESSTESTHHSSRRSSSQASSSSRRSQRPKTFRARSQKSHSASSNATTDLTSFPSLSPDRSPEGFSGHPALNRALTNALLDDGDAPDGASDTGRSQRTTLSKLTSTLSHASSGRAALFGDPVLSHDFPGALHLADDAHIERLVNNTGAVKLVRQFARDLALRDAEISALRQRADARERELKRMLREVAVSNQDIERRLYLLENEPEEKKEDRDGSDNSSVGQAGGPSSGLGGLMEQAMREGVGSHVQEDELDYQSDWQSTIRVRPSGGSRSGASSVNNDSGPRQKRQSSRGWSDYLLGSGTNGRKASRASSVMSGADLGEEEVIGRPRIPSNTTNRRRALDEQLFQPNSQAESAGDRLSGQRIGGPSDGGDYDSIVSARTLPRSISSWTKLFAGNSQSAKDNARAPSDSRRRGDSSAEQDKSKKTLSGTSNGGTSAVAALQRINSSTSVQSMTGRSTNASSRTPRMNVQATRRSAASSVSQGASSGTAPTSSTNLGPVEMDAILPMESRPPTLTHTYTHYQFGDLLTDRFGFIYDQRRKKRQREAAAMRNTAERSNLAETLSSFRSDASDGEEDDESQRPLQMTIRPRPAPTPAPSEGSTETGGSTNKRWQDYLRIATRPTELLSHTPSAGPIVSLTTAGEAPSRSTSVAIDKGGSFSVNSNAQPSASTSIVVADRPEFAGVSVEGPAATSTAIAVNENEPVRLLLEQLTDLHDSLQRERTVRWNEFLRKVRAERRKEREAAAAATTTGGATSDRSLKSVDTPEASLTDGEVVGVAGLGNKGKVGRAKWREFRCLVLGGIPVTLRAKVWSECSGAFTMRAPGYYDHLLKGVGGSEPDPSVIAQIDMDIRRTLTDNVFFRKGPGVKRLREVLVAYARRNPEVGYCQGMNLIAASLLLITPTAEDAFWLLASMIEVILPQHYYDHGLMASRADQVVLRQYISEVLPRLSAHFNTLGIELEALTFQWFLSVFTDCLSAEALYRVWDVILCLNVSSPVNLQGNGGTGNAASTDCNNNNGSATDISMEDAASGNGGGSTFLFQVALALLKLNEQQLLTSCSTPAAVYTYINHQMTNHAISIDGLIQASEALRNVVRREDVVARRTVALKEMQV